MIVVGLLFTLTELNESRVGDLGTVVFVGFAVGIHVGTIVGVPVGWPLGTTDGWVVGVFVG